MVVGERSYLGWSRANLVSNTLLRWYRRLLFTAGRNPRSAATPAHGSRPASVSTALDETKLPHDRSMRFGSAERLDPGTMLAEELDDGDSEEYVVNAWRAEQLRRLGLSPLFAEVFAGLVDWHQIAKLVERGCSAHLALEIVR
jgi:hypothetical protein